MLSTLLTVIAILMLAPALLFAVLFIGVAFGLVRLNDDDV